MRYRLGWTPDWPDVRDHRFAGPTPFDVAALPMRVDLRERQPVPPVQDQRDLGSCTAHALVGALELLELHDGLPLLSLSRLFVYYNARRREHAVASDSGAMLRDGIKGLVHDGVCSEAGWPYAPSRFAEQPPTAAYDAATAHRVTAYARLASLRDMRACLAEGYPFVLGFTCYSSIDSDAVAATGDVPMPRRGDRAEGGHAVCVVGYDDARRVLVFRNSWGGTWGDRGHGTLPFDYVTDPDLCDDRWVLYRAEGL